jgi:hypothetical protein
MIELIAVGYFAAIGIFVFLLFRMLYRLGSKR